MTSVYNVLREACGVSQLEAAENIHETRLDTVKSWSSDRRPAPQWSINQLQSLMRRIYVSGTEYAEILKKTAEGNVYLIGLPHDEADAKICGFPSMAACLQATAVTISQLPDDAEIRLVPRVAGAIAGPRLEAARTTSTETDRRVLMSMRFDKGKFLTRGNMNRRKFERLEDIGWIKGISLNMSDVEYYITNEGKEARQIKPGDCFRWPGDGKLYRAETVGRGWVNLVDENGQKSRALEADIDNCWADEQLAKTGGGMADDDNGEVKAFRVCKVTLFGREMKEGAGEMFESFDTLEEAKAFIKQPRYRGTALKIYLKDRASHSLIEVQPKDERESGL